MTNLYPMNKALIISLLVLVFASCKKNDDSITLQDNFSFAKQSIDVLHAYCIGNFKVDMTIAGPASNPLYQDTVKFDDFYMNIKADSLLWTEGGKTNSYHMSWNYVVEPATQIFYRLEFSGMADSTSNFDLRPKEMKNGYLVLYSSWYSGTWYYLKRIQ